MTAAHHAWTFCITIVSLCAVWYTVSSTANIINKLILEQFPFPLTVAMSSLLGTSLYSVPFMRQLKITHSSLSFSFLLKYVFPLALGKIIAVASSYMSLWKVPVSYAHTVKATMPFFTVLCARIMLKERQTTAVYLSLIPIIVGVVIASATELSFSVFGLLCALCSTFTYALLNSFAKKVLQETSLHHVRLLSLSTQIACVVFLPLWLVEDVSRLWVDRFDSTKSQHFVNFHVFGMLAASGFLNFAQNIVTFTLIHKLTALSYSVANATKRIIIITASLITLRNPVTPMNLFGMFLAVIGVLIYNKAKQGKKPTAVDSSMDMALPFSASDPLFPDQDPLLRGSKKLLDVENGMINNNSGRNLHTVTINNSNFPQRQLNNNYNHQTMVNEERSANDRDQNFFFQKSINPSQSSVSSRATARFFVNSPLQDV